jgi:site-specific DNA-methyltransferase (adenine-specific)
MLQHERTDKLVEPTPKQSRNSLEKRLKRKEMINLHLGDCLEAMKEMPDNTYDLAIVDPPYGIGISSNHKEKVGESKKIAIHKERLGFKNPNKEYFNELIRISKNQIIWGANHFISKLPYNSPCWVVWDKDNGKPFDFSDCELAWTSFSKSLAN